MLKIIVILVGLLNTDPLQVEVIAEFKDINSCQVLIRQAPEELQPRLRCWTIQLPVET